MYWNRSESRPDCIWIDSVGQPNARGIVYKERERETVSEKGGEKQKLQCLCCYYDDAIRILSCYGEQLFDRFWRRLCPFHYTNKTNANNSTIYDRLLLNCWFACSFLNPFSIHTLCCCFALKISVFFPFFSFSLWLNGCFFIIFAWQKVPLNKSIQ